MEQDLNKDETKETTITDDITEMESLADTPTTTTTTTTATTTTGTTARSYECIFCRRGFSTAQALGGHMNIHRRDRPSPRVIKSGSTANTSGSSVEGSSGYYRPYPVHRRLASFSTSTASVLPEYQSTKNYLSQDYSMYGSRSQRVETGISSEGEKRKAQELSLLEKEEDQLQLGLGLHSERVDEVGDQEKSVEGEEEKEKLDLELRLGQDPQ